MDKRALPVPIKIMSQRRRPLSSTLIESDAAPLKAVDDTGRNLIKSGQTLESGFFESILGVYSNLTQNPALLFSFGLVLFIVMAESKIITNYEPIEKILASLKTISADTKEPVFIQSLAKIGIKLFTFILDNKIRFLSVLVTFLPYFAKPSTKNLVFISVIAFYVLFFPSQNWSLFQSALTSQIVLLFVCLRKPQFKFLILAIGLFLVFGMNIEKMLATP